MISTRQCALLINNIIKFESKKILGLLRSHIGSILSSPRAFSRDTRVPITRSEARRTKRINERVGEQGKSSRIERSSVKSHAETLSISIPTRSILASRLISTNTGKFRE